MTSSEDKYSFSSFACRFNNFSIRLRRVSSSSILVSRTSMVTFFLTGPILILQLNPMLKFFYHRRSVGSANNAFPLYSGRFSLTCPRTVLTRLHVYGSPSVTSSYLTHLWIFALHSAHTTKVFLCM